MLRRLIAASLVLAACGGTGTADPTATTDVTPGSRAPEQTTTTVGAAPTTTTPPTTAPGQAAGQAPRATGTATLTAGDEEITVEIYLCGWVVTATDPAHPGGEYEGDVVYAASPGRSDNFLVAGIARQDDGTVVEVILDRRADVTGLVATLAFGDPADETSGLLYVNGLLSSNRVVLSGPRVSSDGPLTLRNQSDVDDTIEVAFDGECTQMGGSMATGAAIAADIVGVALSVAAGTVTIDGVAYEITATTRCVTTAEAADVAADAASDDSEITIEVGGADTIDALSIIADDGRAWQRVGARGEFLVLADGSVRTAGSVSVLEALGATSQVEVDITCP